MSSPKDSKNRLPPTTKTAEGMCYSPVCDYHILSRRHYHITTTLLHLPALAIMLHCARTYMIVSLHVFIPWSSQVTMQDYD